jgi:choline dehydrogenase-like flavoprotein
MKSNFLPWSLITWGLQSDEAMDEYIRSTLHSGNALVGTCAMGLAPENGAVVDADLRVYGVRGLRVADSSVIPQIPGCLFTPIFAFALCWC